MANLICTYPEVPLSKLSRSLPAFLPNLKALTGPVV